MFKKIFVYYISTFRQRKCEKADKKRKFAMKIV